MKAQRKHLEKRLEEKRAKITAGDDLAPGVLKMVPYVGLSKRTARPPWAPPDAGACERPVPGVVNWLPRVFKNTLNGVTGAVVVVSVPPAPSQLISRRPLGSGPGLLPFGAPRAARY
jgi:hypothetical protein